MGWLMSIAIVVSALPHGAVEAADPKYVLVRLDEVHITDDGDGGPGELRYVTVGSTGDHGEDPIAVQQNTFPLELWVEADEDGANSTFMSGSDSGYYQALPIFAYPEDQMGEELLFSVSVFDDDETPDWVPIGHRVLAEIGGFFADYYGGPAGRAAHEALSSAIQDELERGIDQDHLGTITVSLPRRARDRSTYGMPAGEHGITLETWSANGKVKITYTILRIADRPWVDDWCMTLYLDRVKIIDDSEDLGAAHVYLRSRVADRYLDGVDINGTGASQLRQTSIRWPNRGTIDVDSGQDFLNGRTILYSNTRGSGRDAYCSGLPVFLFAEIDVLSDDWGLSADDDAIGIMTFLIHQSWMRDHTGQSDIRIRVRGTDGSTRVYLTLEIWDPHEIVF
jgi:hypothetical protein